MTTSRNRLLVATAVVVLLVAAAGTMYWRSRDSAHLAPFFEYQRTADAQIVTVFVTVGEDDRVLRHETVETDTQVRVSVWVHRAHNNTPHPAVAKAVTITLRQPLGDRGMVNRDGVAARER